MEYDYDLHDHHSLQQAKEKYAKKGLCGLINLGNKCYLNSIIQCLSNTLKLSDYILSNEYKKDKPSVRDNFVLSYINLISHIWQNNELLRPKSFIDTLGKRIIKYNSFQQQDSHECLLYILDLLHKGLSYEIEVVIEGQIRNETDRLMKSSLESWKKFYEKEYSFIIDTFNGLFYTKINCQHCDFSEDVFEPFNSLSIEIPLDNKEKSINIYDCLSRHLGETEIISTWNCEKCKKRGCKKTTRIWSLPNYLIIHFKRFTNTNTKITRPVDFPLDDLNLTKFFETEKKDPNNYLYSLYGVNYHSGGVNSGHYWSCCKNLDKNWYLYNDGHVSKFNNVNDMLTKDAYVLFYYRKFIRK